MLARLTQLDNTWPGRDEAALDANISNLFDVQRMHRRSLQRSPIRQPPPLPRPPPRRPGGHPPFPAPCPSPSAWSFAAPQHGGASGGGDGGGRRSAGWSTVFPHLIDNGVYHWTDPRCPYLQPIEDSVHHLMRCPDCHFRKDARMVCTHSYRARHGATDNAKLCQCTHRGSPTPPPSSHARGGEHMGLASVTARSTCHSTPRSLASASSVTRWLRRANYSHGVRGSRR